MTERKPLFDTYFLKDLRVFAVEASAQPAEKSYLNWGGSYGPFEIEAEPGVLLVIATLSGGSSSGRASITVGGLVTPVKVPEDGTIGALSDSSALETIYDFAKVGLRQAASAVGAKIKLPLRSPEAQLAEFSS